MPAPRRWLVVRCRGIAHTPATQTKLRRAASLLPGFSECRGASLLGPSAVLNGMRLEIRRLSRIVINRRRTISVEVSHRPESAKLLERRLFTGRGCVVTAVLRGEQVEVQQHRWRRGLILRLGRAAPEKDDRGREENGRSQVTTACHDAVGRRAAGRGVR